MERNTRSKSEQEYVKALIQGLSLQRMTDAEIADYLHNEKGIEIARTPVNATKNRIERSAEKWYVELRQSSYKYIATYKQRIDSFLSNQKKLHDIISTTKKDEVKIRAISELHRIEISLHTLMKELPGDIKTTKDNEEKEHEKGGRLTFDEWMSQNSRPRIAEDSEYGDEENGKYYWDLHKKYNEYDKEWGNSMFGIK